MMLNSTRMKLGKHHCKWWDCDKGELRNFLVFLQNFERAANIDGNGELTLLYFRSLNM